MSEIADLRGVVANLRARLQQPRQDQRFLPLEEFLCQADFAALAADLQPYHKATVDAIARALAGLWVHLPFKRARYGVSPMDALAALSRQLPMPPGDFSRAMLDIFLDLHDPHTTYELAAPWDKATAFLPFQAGLCFTKPPTYQGQTKHCFVVTQVTEAVAAEFAAVGFVPRATITHWNGMPMESVVHAAAQRENGANPHACLARAVRNLTMRPLVRLLPPDAPSVLLRYVPPGAGAAGARELLIDWSVQAERKESTRRLLFGDPPAGDWKSWEGLPVDYRFVRMAHPTSAEPVETALLRIRTFDIPRTLFRAQLPKLIDHLRERAPLAMLIDVRGNGGGEIQNGEYLLQLLTPGPITPASFQFLNTALVRQLVGKNEPESAEIFGVDRDTGALFSRPGQITPTERANAIGQRYYGRVGLITDALCYSTTDIFAAGFQDHRIGPVIGVDPTTGGGGANVWHYGAEIAGTKTEDGYEFPKLPLGVDMGVSVRQSLRTGRFHGEILEDFGVTADHLYLPVETDLFDGGQGLYEFAFAQLQWGEGLPEVTLDLRVIPDSDGRQLTIEAQTSGVGRGEIVIDGKNSFVFPADPAGQRWSATVKAEENMESYQSVELRGYRVLPRASYPYYPEAEAAQIHDAAKLTYHLVGARKVLAEQPQWSRPEPGLFDLPVIQYPGAPRNRLLYFVNGATRAPALEALTVVDELRKLRPDLEVRFVTYGRGASALSGAGQPFIDLALPARPPQYAVIGKFAEVWRTLGDFDPVLIVAHEEPEIAREWLPAPCVWLTADWKAAAFDADRFRAVRHTVKLAAHDESDPAKRFRAVGPPVRPLRYWSDEMGDGEGLRFDMAAFESPGSTEPARLRAKQQAREHLGMPLDELLVAVFTDPAGASDLTAPLYGLVRSAFDQIDATGHACHVLTPEGVIEKRAYQSKRLLLDPAGLTREGPFFEPGARESVMAAADLAIIKDARGIGCELSLLGVPTIAIHAGAKSGELGLSPLFAPGLGVPELLEEMRGMLVQDWRHSLGSPFEGKRRPPGGLTAAAREIDAQLAEIEGFLPEAVRRARRLLAGGIALPEFSEWLDEHMRFCTNSDLLSAVSEFVLHYNLEHSPNPEHEGIVIQPSLDAEGVARMGEILGNAGVE